MARTTLPTLVTFDAEQEEHVARVTAKTVLWGIAYLPFFLMALLLVTDVTILGRHFYGDEPFAVGPLLADLWPGPTLKALVVLAVFATGTSKWFDDFLGRLQLHGSVLVLLFFLTLLLASVLIVDHYQLYYPDVLEDDRVLVAMKLTLMVLPLPLLALVMNDSLARPAPKALIIGLWVALFAVVKIWSVQVFSGELDLMSPIAMWFDD